MGYDKLVKAVLCAPTKEFFNVRDYDFQHLKPGISRELALKQYFAFESALKKFGVKIIHIKELENHPNSVFVRDTAVFVKDGFIKVRMGLPARRGEPDWMANFLEELGFEKYGEIKPPATLEGGDVIIGEKIAFVGISSRTNKKGTTQISRILKNLGFEVRVARFNGPFLHIGGGMSLVSDNTVISCRNSFPEGFFDGLKNIEIDCNDFIGGNVVSVGKGNIIAEKRNSSAINKLTENGFNVFHLDLSEFVKGNGGPSCMVLPLN